jgi:hypothetical protein
MLVVVEDERPGFVGMEDTCALVGAVVAPTTIADVDVVVLVTAAVVNAFVVAVVGELAAVQAATGRLEQGHWEGFVVQSCGFR